jgi:hypothetical protein
MAGEQNCFLTIRCSQAEKDRFKEALAKGRRTSLSDAVRAYMRHYGEWTDAAGRQPDPVEEVFKPPKKR